MAMHEIEGLVEDSVHLVAKSTMSVSVKRDMLFNLYNFQAMYDTGYTHFRLMDTLLDLKFTYRIPLKKHPDYLKDNAYFDGLDTEKTTWIPATIAEKGESVFARKEQNGVFLYADAGSGFWQRLCQENVLPKSEHQAPKTIETSSLIAQLLQEADAQEELQILYDWYALLVNFLGVDLLDEDGFPGQFLEFIQRKEVNAIRQIGLKNKVFSKKEFCNDWASLETPVLKEIEEEESNVERLFCLKWLLDFKTDESKIKSAYLKEITPDPKRAAKIQIIPDTAEKYLGDKNWKLVSQIEYADGHKWLYHKQLRGKEGVAKDTDLHAYLFLDANTKDVKLLYPKICIQHGLLNRWQGRTAIHDLEYLHFFQSLNSYVPTEDWDSNKSLHYMGGWKFSLKSSEKTLKTHVENLFGYFEKYIDELLQEYEKPLFNNFEMTPEDAKFYLEKNVQRHQFFHNYLELYLAYAIHYFESGDTEKAYGLAEKVKTRATAKKHPVAKEWQVSAQSILDGKPKMNELLSMERNYF